MRKLILIAVIATVLATPAVASAFIVSGRVTEFGTAVGPGRTVDLYKDGVFATRTTTDQNSVYIVRNAPGGHYYQAHAYYAAGCFIHEGWSVNQYATTDIVDNVDMRTVTRFC